MDVLVDHNMEGEAALLWDTLDAEGWLAPTPLQLLRFADVGLPLNSSDRAVWRFVQERHTLLLTDNRNERDADSSGRTIRDEAVLGSLPVLTIGRRGRLEDPAYRRRCAERLVDIVLDLHRHPSPASLHPSSFILSGGSP